jgi:hypothetical protein
LVRVASSILSTSNSFDLTIFSFLIW